MLTLDVLCVATKLVHHVWRLALGLAIIRDLARCHVLHLAIVWHVTSVVPRICCVAINVLECVVKFVLKDIANNVLGDWRIELISLR